MSASLPPVLDAWRMVAAKRLFDGRLPLSGMSRLRPVLADADGDCRFEVEFGVDAMGMRYVDVRAEAELPLLCQRSLERFLHPVRINQRLGLVTDESQEAALPEGVEPLLLDASGELNPAGLVEDELILAVPVVPIDPASAELEAEWPEEAEVEEKPNPFAALAALKEQKK
ncbi:YceD family protein [Arenimonas donghaensis]|uniref:YceD family protein n=1 Tax=Arenimonas donghaensis TaxID=375061 RepID=UPI00054F6C1E|nr:YceD family protein [Arenimonas donghaensis]